MSHCNIYEEEVDLNTFPTFPPAEFQIAKGAQLTIGDLHGNACKLIHFLIKHKVLTNVTPQDYSRFILLYKVWDSGTVKQDDLNWFLKWVASFQFSTSGTVRFIGDELADRGANDYFTLKILEKMSLEQVPFEIMFSNHSAEFISCYEKKVPFLLGIIVVNIHI